MTNLKPIEWIVNKLGIHRDLILHFLVGIVIGLVCTAFAWGRFWFIGVAVASLIFIGKEVYDCLKPNPSGFDYKDLLADYVGYLLGALIIICIVCL